MKTLAFVTTLFLPPTFVAVRMILQTLDLSVHQTDFSNGCLDTTQHVNV